MTDVWKLVMGVNIKKIDLGIYLFQFYHKDDMKWVLNGGHRAFDNEMLLVYDILFGEEPVKVQLWNLNLWIQTRRTVGQGKSKWLREEGDADSEFKIGMDNNIPFF